MSVALLHMTFYNSEDIHDSLWMCVHLAFHVTQLIEY